MSELRPPDLESDQEYARILNEGSFWEPFARAAVAAAGVAQPGQLLLAKPVGTYPTLISDTGLVVKLFGDRCYGSASYAAERDAYRVLAGRGLPVPELVATGELFGAQVWPWPYLIMTTIPSELFASAVRQLDVAPRHALAR